MENILQAIKDGIQPEEAANAFLALQAGEQESLVEQLGQLRSENSAKFLNLLLDKITDKKLQKLIKKNIFRLKTQGIKVEEPKIAGEPVLKKTETSREARAYVTNYDPEESRAILVAAEIKKNQFFLSHAITHFSKGLMQMAGFPLARNEFEGIIADFSSKLRPPVRAIPVSVPYAGYLLEEASGLSGKDVEEARGLKRFLADHKGNVRKPNDIYGLETDQGTYSEPIERILGHGLFEPFQFTWPGMEDDKKRLSEVINPSIVLPPYVVHERREAFLKELVENENVRSQIRFLKRMLEDYAYFYYCLGEFRNYKGIIDQVSNPEGIRAALLHFVAKSMSKPEEKEEQPGMIVDPFAPAKR
jgi:hypothetical protein